MFYPQPNKYLIVLFAVLLTMHTAKAQLGKEAWHWQFGQNAAIDFSSGTPVTGTCAINTNEGSASVSDPNTGALLFYTDGTKAWDKNNNQMPNGFGMIGGQGTSTQAALIVPKPGSSTIYYLISADQGGYCCPGNPMANQGVNYSIVDMTLNSGLGDVTIKNQPLTPPPTTEKLTAVRHCNGTDYWIITHPFNSNAFNVYLLTAAGINPAPIVSNVGTIEQNLTTGTYNNEAIGYIKASPNGKKIVCAVFKTAFLEIFDFNNSNGQISNPIKINYINNETEAYGVAFSPDNTKLYTALDVGGIFQYDLSSNNSNTIITSQINIDDSIPSYDIGALQLAPNGKIYVSFQSSSTLAVINNPNGLGLSCNYRLQGLNLALGSNCEYGLPNFIDANNPFKSQTFITILCAFPNYTLNANGNSHYQWLNGDTTKNLSINSFGNYWVSFIDSVGCKEVDTFHVIQTRVPVITVLHDTSQCSNLVTPVVIDATYPNTNSYNWNDGFTSPIHTITNADNYWVDYTLNNFCVSRDSFNYTINNIPSVNLGNDTTFCLGDLPLNAFNPSSNYLWNTEQTNSEIIATVANTYWVKVTNQYGCINTDTLIVYPQLKAFNFVLPNIVTPNNDGINDFIDFGKYQFSSLQLEIYNRWGKKVFESIDPTILWTPTEEDGTYFLVLNYQLNCGTQTQSKILKEFISIAH